MNYTLVQKRDDAIVDLHVVTYDKEDPILLDYCLRTLKASAVNVWLINNDQPELLSARNLGFSLGDCPYVSYVNGDDYVDSDLMAKMVEWVRVNTPAAVFSNSYIVRDGVKMLMSPPGLMWDYELENSRGPVPHQVLIMERNLVLATMFNIMKNPQFEGLLDLGSDYAMCAEISLARLWQYYDAPVHTWVKRPGSWSTSGVFLQLAAYYRKKRIAYVQSLPKPQVSS